MSAAPYHIPVMVDAVTRLTLEVLHAGVRGPIVDATLGGGGHAAALLAATAELNPAPAVIGVDQDPDALAAATARLGADPRFTTRRGNFRDLPTLLADTAPAALILADLGVSSWQLDAPHRGFAIKHPASALDMRMDPSTGLSARDLILASDADQIAKILRDYGEVRGAYRLALRMKEAAAAGQLETTGALAALVERDSARQLKVHPATLVFQALRIAVNDELGALESLLAHAPDLLAPGGRLLIMSYHSLEDRLTKHTFAEGHHGPPRPARLPPPSDWRQRWVLVTTQALRADDAEIAMNPRARSARLRAAARPKSTRGVRCA